MHNPLLTDIQYLKGVGPIRAKTLRNELHVATLRDLLYQFPYKYIDRSVIHRVADLEDGISYVQLKGQILSKNVEGQGHKQRLVAIFSDGTAYVELVWFAGIKTIQKKLKCNYTYLLLGKPTAFNGRISISHPEIEDAENRPATSPTMQPHYHLTERMKRAGITSRTMSEWIARAFETLQGTPIPETLPETLKQQYRLIDLDRALHSVHSPRQSTDLPEATRRLKFEELFFIQLDILRYMHDRRRAAAGYRFLHVGELFLTFYHHHLPFSLTDAQKRVIKEIRQDVATGRQMNRLLQGDVGSGKTMVALLCCLLAMDNNFQTCIMAPTEILAEQHFTSITEYLDGMPIRVALLTGSVKGRRRHEILEGVADGSIQLLVGTHALIEPTVRFLNLGLVIIDEQHRFGVKQRASLWQKNTYPPHILVMTATPIPRTLAMTVYGDLDVSIIDQLPPGRKPIQTVHYRQGDRFRLYQGMRYQLQLGRQIYVVYPLIKGNEKQNLRDLESGYAQLIDAFPDYRIGMVHGKMKSVDKDAAMQAFKQQQCQILVSTTVIEVGVNVPNASVMVVENAERFGLAQLHQLRGRVGRGAEQSYCILVTNDKLSETTRRRMQVMVDSTDGFVIAEEDMKLRGPGDMEGTAQSGMPFDLRIANIVKDVDLMQLAREAAAAILEADPEQRLPRYDIIWQQLRLLKKDLINFSAIS